MKRRLKLFFLILLLASLFQACTEDEQDFKASIGNHLEKLVKERDIQKVIPCSSGGVCDSSPVDFISSNHEFLSNDLLRLDTRIFDLRKLFFYRIDEVLGQDNRTEKRLLLFFSN
jgi:hypothetical protein